MNVLDHEKLHQKYFEELSRIPRASFKEERVSDYLEDFARTRGLDYKRDTIGNVVIYKPASAGYEDHGAVILQAHTDMVCEKMRTAPIILTGIPDLYIENGILKARGTTLGADDGMGCAYMLGASGYGYAPPGPGMCLYSPGGGRLKRGLCVKAGVFYGEKICEPGFRRTRKGNVYHQRGGEDGGP